MHFCLGRFLFFHGAAYFLESLPLAPSLTPLVRLNQTHPNSSPHLLPPPRAVDLIFCPTGGTMYSEKDIYGMTQTLGDHDQGGLLSRWDKTRFMRHALVIR